jgi:hypothetical protein
MRDGHSLRSCNRINVGLNDEALDGDRQQREVRRKPPSDRALGDGRACHKADVRM